MIKNHKYLPKQALCFTSLTPFKHDHTLRQITVFVVWMHSGSPQHC